jgi:hypothetical protein
LRPLEPARARRHRGPRREGHRRQSGSGPCAGGRRPDARWRSDHRRHHQLHQHQQPAQRDRRRPAGAQRAAPGPDAQALGQELARAGLQDRGPVPGRGGADAGPRGSGLRHRRVRLHHLQRHVGRARPRDPARDHRPRPVCRGGAFGQPQFRRPHPPLRQAGLPRFAAAGGGLRAGGHDPLRYRARFIWHRRRRQAHHAQGPLAQRRRDRRHRARGRQAAAVPRGLHPHVRAARRQHDGRAAALRLAPAEHLHSPPAVLGRRAGR